MNSATPNHWDGFLDLRVGLTIYPSHDKAIDQVLSQLAERCPAQFILLSDTSGQLVAVQGTCGESDLIALSSLVAGDMVASQEIARITGQYHTCQMVMREGQNVNTFVTEAGQYLILFMQVSNRVPLGWARLLIRETGRQIAEIVSTPPEAVEDMHIGFSDENLDNIVDQELDLLWNA